MIFVDIKPKYVVNEKGRKTAVVLSIKDYRALMQRLEDLEDALDLDRAVETATGFREYSEIRAELQVVLRGVSDTPSGLRLTPCRNDNRRSSRLHD